MCVDLPEEPRLAHPETLRLRGLLRGSLHHYPPVPPTGPNFAQFAPHYAAQYAAAQFALHPAATRAGPALQPPPVPGRAQGPASAAALCEDLQVVCAGGRWSAVFTERLAGVPALRKVLVGRFGEAARPGAAGTFTLPCDADFAPTVEQVRLERRLPRGWAVYYVDKLRGAHAWRTMEGLLRDARTGGAGEMSLVEDALLKGAGEAMRVGAGGFALDADTVEAFYRQRTEEACREGGEADPGWAEGGGGGGGGGVLGDRGPAPTESQVLVVPRADALRVCLEVLEAQQLGPDQRRCPRCRKVNNIFMPYCEYTCGHVFDSVAGVA